MPTATCCCFEGRLVLSEKPDVLARQRAMFSPSVSVYHQVFCQEHSYDIKWHVRPRVPNSVLDYRPNNANHGTLSDSQHHKKKTRRALTT